MIEDGILELIDGYLDGTADDGAVAQIDGVAGNRQGQRPAICSASVSTSAVREILVADNTTRCLNAGDPAELEGSPDELTHGKPAANRPITFPGQLDFGAGGTFTNLPTILFAIALASILGWAAFQLGWKNGARSIHLAERASAGSEGAPYVPSS